MWSFKKNVVADIRLTNTLTGAKELFKPITTGRVLLYSCGPTVYGPIQIGNLRSFVLGDLVARMLTLSSYRVKRIMNITDVGHMVGDGDGGEDKMAVGAARDATTPEAIAERYTKLFLENIEALGLDTRAIIFPRATGYIKEQIEMIRALEKKGFTYKTGDGVYFDTAKFPDYGMLGGLRNVELRAGARVELGEKRLAHDFALWRTAKPNDLQQWDSPWGKGNPGWSIECSAMATTLLGTQIDIHTGGEDNAPIHHNNEIAQSECASGQHPFVRYWLHGAFLTMGGEKLSKSLGNSYTLKDITDRGFHPLALRYLFLQAHYRSPLSFSWEALEAAREALESLWRKTRALRVASGAKAAPSKASEDLSKAFADDLSTPQALALLWNIPSELTPQEQWGVIETADAVLGLSLVEPPQDNRITRNEDLPSDLRAIDLERKEARANKDFAKSDGLRIHFEKRGYLVEDTASGTIYIPKQK